MTSTRTLTQVLFALAAAGLPAACGGGSSSRRETTPVFQSTLGIVRTLTSSCARGSGTLPGGACRVVRVSGGSLPPLIADVRIAQPPSGTTPLGTVVLGSGGGGVDFYEDVSGGERVAQRLLGDGYVVVQRAWRSDWADAAGAGAKAASRRYAILIDWVHATIHPGGVFAVTGNSGGSAEIGYALTTWGMAARIDVAVLSSGPPMSRLDLLCGSPITSAWASQCASIVPAGTLQCGTHECNEPTNSVCTLLGPNPTQAQLLDDSVLHPNAQLSFPTTRVHVLVGTADCSIAVPQALLFTQAVTTPVVTEFVPMAPHWLPQIPAGQDAVVQALESASPATANRAVVSAAWPRLGAALAVMVDGPAGSPFQVLLGTRAGSTWLPPLGRLGLASPWITIGRGRLGAAGRAVVRVPMPDDPALAGDSLFPQALVGDRLSNAMRVVVRR